jgi:hemoglobin
MERIVTADVRIDEEQLRELVERFYGRVRADPMLGPLFNQAVRDWPEHLSKLADFWSSVMLTSGRYKGNPMAAHLKHQARITPAMFERWLALWGETTADMMPWAADELQAKAARIAASLQLALFFRPDSAVRIVHPSQGVRAA